jgi:hypothetical protein
MPLPPLHVRVAPIEISVAEGFVPADIVEQRRPFARPPG